MQTSRTYRASLLFAGAAVGYALKALVNEPYSWERLGIILVFLGAALLHAWDE